MKEKRHFYSFSAVGWFPAAPENCVSVLGTTFLLHRWYLLVQVHSVKQRLNVPWLVLQRLFTVFTFTPFEPQQIPFEGELYGCIF